MRLCKPATQTSWGKPCNTKNGIWRRKLRRQLLKLYFTVVIRYLYRLCQDLARELQSINAFLERSEQPVKPATASLHVLLFKPAVLNSGCSNLSQSNIKWISSHICGYVPYVLFKFSFKLQVVGACPNWFLKLSLPSGAEASCHCFTCYFAFKYNRAATYHQPCYQCGGNS